ncbi:MAG: hypothetical protein J7L53_02275 [Deltaproteobacteria bacterium]|nr:hypothetical protein [Deltaproteobacteria bacterium]
MSEKTDNESEKSYLKLCESTPNEYEERLARYIDILRSEAYAALKSTGKITGLKAAVKNKTPM